MDASDEGTCSLLNADRANLDTLVGFEKAVNDFDAFTRSSRDSLCPLLGQLLHTKRFIHCGHFP